MAVKVVVPFKREFTTTRDPQSTFDYFADVTKSVPGNFPGVEQFEPIGPNRYRWVFEKIGYSSYELQIKLATEFHPESPRVLRATPIPEKDAANFTGAWNFTPEGDGTRVAFEAKFEIELPVPFFLKSMAEPLAQKELSKIFDRYIDRVEKNLAK